MIESVLEIASQASSVVLKYYRSQELEVRLKSDQSPLTLADLESHALITAALEQFKYPVVSEEEPVEYEKRKHWSIFWLVDPLDGTKDFVAATDEFTINIALIKNMRPVLGVVAVPALGLYYYAQMGKGAFRLKGGHRTRIFNERNGDEIICAESRFHASPQTIEFCRRHGITRVKTLGSALKLCKIAEGTIDVYPRFKPTMEWDTAAGHCILNEAGGKVVDIVTRQELLYNKESLRNNGFVACVKTRDFI